MKLSVVLFLFAFSSLAMATSLKHFFIYDVVKAECSNTEGGMFSLDVEEETVKASFAGLRGLTNEHYGNYKTVEVMEEYPADEYDALGGLADNGDGQSFGNTSLLFVSSAPLSPKQKAQAFFMDQSGDSKMEEMDCDLTFKN